MSYKYIEKQDWRIPEHLINAGWNTTKVETSEED